MRSTSGATSADPDARVERESRFQGEYTYGTWWYPVEGDGTAHTPRRPYLQMSVCSGDRNSEKVV